ncbi:aminophospholipid-transporting P-type ATPase [Laccaria bicolor S238N-H82]|uniref:Aminophospholipid-transporting P-type ATPase n=1 Tax=Laccaria bicolor (strain S238N-H82 / ATCC MYA-4686) TaxID=486041 RepID=B0D0Z0_LACBS|nr:aminophospholipid-transporting P-type ATPase [Laccaria bicolor S238N-H82]EDR11913.1 aminophospholipid-transporting P-type ATPase [Laccaria bicolor S238N-H82]|eukprot:XP_001877810.1 aminophospholipid-transporting P-type ATPase [Laccaria bicolor S238N-H82]
MIQAAHVGVGISGVEDFKLPYSGSFIFTKYFLPLCAVVAPAIGKYSDIVHRLWTNSVFYFVLIFIPLFCLVRDFVGKEFVTFLSQERYVETGCSHRFRYSEILQVQKAIKKVRATQCMRRNCRFAFSQTEMRQNRVRPRSFGVQDIKIKCAVIWLLD